MRSFLVSSSLIFSCSLLCLTLSTVYVCVRMVTVYNDEASTPDVQGGPTSGLYLVWSVQSCKTLRGSGENSQNLQNSQKRAPHVRTEAKLPKRLEIAQDPGCWVAPVGQNDR